VDKRLITVEVHGSLMCQPFCTLFYSILTEGQNCESFQGIYSENAVCLTLY